MLNKESKPESTPEVRTVPLSNAVEKKPAADDKDKEHHPDAKQMDQTSGIG